jgi:DNA-binding IclR family transcriptional regulator
MGIQSVERAIGILNTIAARRSPLSLQELADSLNLAKTTIYTLAKTLKDKGFLQQDLSTRKYQLGFALYELGSIQVSEIKIQRSAEPVLERLAQSTGAECRLGIWDRKSVLITLSAHPASQDWITRQIGPRIPAYCTALGKAILASLKQEELKEYLESIKLVRYTDTTITNIEALLNELEIVRTRGYSISDGELMNYRKSLAVPVFGISRAVSGAISISINQQSIITAREEIIIDKLLRAAQEISMNLGFDPTLHS